MQNNHIQLMSSTWCEHFIFFIEIALIPLQVQKNSFHLQSHIYSQIHVIMLLYQNNIQILL